MCESAKERERGPCAQAPPVKTAYSGDENGNVLKH